VNGSPRADRLPARILAAACLLVLAAAALRVALHDPTSEPVSGDQASFVYQALSLRGGDLAYDEADQARWLELGWADQPQGLFVQRRDDGWAFAKPLGYSVLLAPAMAVAGPYGISAVGAVLVLAYAGCWYGLGRLRWPVATSLAVATAATVASHAWLFGFPAHADLFVAVVVGVALLSAARAALHPRSGAVLWLVVASAAAALLVTEKLPALVVAGPVLALALWRAPWRGRLAAAAAGAAILAVSVAPYLFYSDGSSWSAYGGDRYYAVSTTPWSGGTEADLTPWQTRDSFSPGQLIDQLADPSEDLPSAALTYVIGRHTGAVTFQPVAGFLLVAAGAAALRSRRRGRRPGAAGPGVVPPAPAGLTPANAAGRGVPPSTASDGPAASPGTEGSWRWVGPAAAAGLVGYVAVYLVAFTDNYFGGGQSIGNRYFLQISPAVALVAAAAPVTARAARWCAGAAAVAAVAVLYPLLRSPEEAFFHIERTSAIQRALPFDGTQVHSWRFECEPAECVPPPLEAFES